MLSQGLLAPTDLSLGYLFRDRTAKRITSCLIHVTSMSRFKLLKYYSTTGSKITLKYKVFFSNAQSTSYLLTLWCIINRRCSNQRWFPFLKTFSLISAQRSWSLLQTWSCCRGSCFCPAVRVLMSPFVIGLPYWLQKRWLKGLDSIQSRF